MIYANEISKQEPYCTIDMITGKFKLHEQEVADNSILTERKPRPLFSMTHQREYPPINCKSFDIKLDNDII